MLSDPLVKELAQVYREAWGAFLALHADNLPTGSVEVGERVGEAFAWLLDEISRPPVTLVHGDLRVENLFFGAASGDNALAVIDWQLCCRGRGAFDVAYLLCQSMAVADRRREEWTIVGRWQKALVRHGVTGYSFSDAVEDYKRSALVCLGWAVAGAALERPNERARRWRVSRPCATSRPWLTWGRNLLHSSLSARWLLRR